MSILASLPYDVYVAYAYVGVICAGIIAIILNRAKTTEFKDTIDWNLVLVFVFFIIFCIFDAAWGLTGSVFAHHMPLAFEIMSYVFHSLAAVSSFVCSWYAAKYLRFERKANKILNIVRIVILVIQFGFIFQNIWSGNFFTVDAEGVYSSSSLRPVVFGLQFLQYMPIAIFSFIKAIVDAKNKRRSYLYLSAGLFLLIPCIFGILQMLYPDGPFYSMGFTVFSVAIYSINVTKQREKFLSESSRVEEQKKSQEAIAVALESVKEANDSKSKFLANMSHDIRTPINGIMGVVQLAKKENDVDKLQEYIDKIDKTSQHLLSLINDVLDITLFENKQNSVIKEVTTDLRMIVDNCYSIIAGQLVNRNIYFTVKYASEPKNPIVMADQLRLKQIFINVLGNAVKFTKVGGITFEIEERSSSSSSNFVEYIFKISDTGIGMSEEFKQHIFEPFSQESNSSRTKYQGTGLGMAITKQLVELMKGSVEVESTYGKGTTFIIKIPFKISSQSELVNQNVKKDETVIDLKGLKIMLVEDNELNMEIAQTILESYGAIVTPAVNGQEAVETFNNNPENTFDVILMDIMMPILNGYEATKAIRASDKPGAKVIPIIAMTANAFDEDKKKALLSGMNGHISKPVNYEELCAEIKRNLKK